MENFEKKELFPVLTKLVTVAERDQQKNKQRKGIL